MAALLTRFTFRVTGVMGSDLIAVVAPVIDRVASVAVSGQAPLTSGTTLANVAVPELADSVVVPERAHGDVMTMTSDDPTPVVSTLLYWSSIETANGGKGVPAVTSSGEGATVNVRRDGAAAEIAIEELAADKSLPGVVVSVAITVHDKPVSIVTDRNVAVPAVAVSVSELDCDKAHEEPMVMESVDPAPEVIVAPSFSIETAKEAARGEPATALAGGSVVKAIPNPDAAAGSISRNAMPLNIKITTAPGTTIALQNFLKIDASLIYPLPSCTGEPSSTEHGSNVVLGWPE